MARLIKQFMAEKNVRFIDPGNIARNWLIEIILAVYGIYFYIFMEWLFFITKPSFMSNLGHVDALRVLLVTPIPAAALGVAGVFLCWIPTFIIRNRTVQALCLAIGLLMPASILAVLMLLLVDNFTYTIFGFGIISTEGFLRLVYGFLLLVLAFFSYRFLHNLKRKLINSIVYRKLAILAPGLLLVSVLFALFAPHFSGVASMKRNADTSSLKGRPNILLLAGDGLNAESMSVYGYHRDTTPFIRELAENALLCENAFANSGCSGASISSMFTGKLPTQTRLIYPPDILKGKDAYQHLPGIVRMHGYWNIDISVRHYADPYDLNMRNSFDWANYREINGNRVSERLSSVIGQEPDYFFNVLSDRAASRIQHVFGVRTMEDPLAEVIEPEEDRSAKPQASKDEKRIRTFFSLIDSSPSPFFAHLHLNQTHGAKYRPQKRFYSEGKEQTEPCMTDFYDDVILEFDNHVREIIKGLDDRGIRDNTVIVICTDHGQRWTVKNRIPLLFLFPSGAHKGHIKENVQNLDIAATILDYLSFEQPYWMGGLSLLSSRLESHRVIFAVDRKHGGELKTSEGRELSGTRAGPPFYSLGSVSVIFCHKYFELNLERNTLVISDIKGHTSPCNEDDIPSPERIARLIIDHLATHEYDTSSLSAPYISSLQEKNKEEE